MTSQTKARAYFFWLAGWLPEILCATSKEPLYLRKSTHMPIDMAIPTPPMGKFIIRTEARRYTLEVNARFIIISR